MLFEYNPTNNDFSLQRLRFDFNAIEARRFPDGKAGNVFRGALGWAMRDLNPDAYRQFFEPRQNPGSGPSGFANPPRPFVLRAHHLDGRTFQPGEPFHADLHLFRQTPPEAFIQAMERVPLGRLRAVSCEPVVLPLGNRHENISRMTVRFVTATELKMAGSVSGEPEFPILFSRARDRLRSLLGRSLTLDFPGMATRSREITMTSSKLIHESRRRTSSKTGQTHPLGGFRGEASYEGDLDEFVPLLEAACWTGIGRQTVWGKGVIELKRLP
jgi:hypothetical protein